MLKSTKISIETLILVAVWESPSIFQGCFKITATKSKETVLYFFRCQYDNPDHTNKINDDFSPDDYHFSYLHDELNLIQLDNLDKVQELAVYALKYALHTTLLEMLKHRQKKFLFIDDVAMQAMIERIKPTIKHNLLANLDGDLGFSASMEFTPQDESALIAATTLLTKFANQSLLNINIH